MDNGVVVHGVVDAMDKEEIAAAVDETIAVESTVDGE